MHCERMYIDHDLCSIVFFVLLPNSYCTIVRYEMTYITEKGPTTL